MKKWTIIVIAVVLVIAAAVLWYVTKSHPYGLQPTQTETPVSEAAPTKAPAPTLAPRTDASGKPIETAFAEGSVKAIEGDVITVDCDGESRTFLLSERAQKDVSSLGIAVETRIIINYNEDGTAQPTAVNLEKIVAE